MATALEWGLPALQFGNLLKYCPLVCGDREVRSSCKVASAVIVSNTHASEFLALCFDVCKFFVA